MHWKPWGEVVGFDVGQRIADYEVESLLGVGGMGRVYRVRHVISQRTEAMKVLLADLSAEPEVGARFLGEIRTLAGLDHAHIAQLRTALQTGNELVMIMEFVDGCTLQALAQQAPIPATVVVGYMQQVLSALSYAHSRGVVHRDIKPANIMVTTDGVVKLTDFGIAKSKSKDELTRPGTTVGSLNYMSPEQALGGCTADGRSDIYSVGITLYELLAGRRPFEDESAYVILHSQLNVVPTPPIVVNPLLPRVLSDLIMKALEKDPGKRFQSAAALSDALRQATGIAAADPPFTAAHVVPDAVADALSWFSTGGHRRLWVASASAATVFVVGAAILGTPHLLKHGPNALAAQPVAVQSVVARTIERPTISKAGPEQPPQEAPQQAPKLGSAKAALPSARASNPDHVSQKKPQRPAPSTTQAIHDMQEPADAQEQPPRHSLDTASLREIEEIRKQRAALEARANAVKASVKRLRTAEAAEGDVLNTDVAGAYVDMNMNLSAEKSDLDDGDVAGARGHMEKAAYQVSLLEKLLNEKTN